MCGRCGAGGAISGCCGVPGITYKGSSSSGGAETWTGAVDEISVDAPWLGVEVRGVEGDGGGGAVAGLAVGSGDGEGDGDGEGSCSSMAIVAYTCGFGGTGTSTVVGQ